MPIHREDQGPCFAIAAISTLAVVGFMMVSGGASGTIEAVASELTGKRCASDLPPFMLSVEGGGGGNAGASRNRQASIPCFPEGSALIGVRGAGVSPADVTAIAGGDAVTLGADVSGVVVSGDCYELRAGDEVIGLSSSGSFAQFAVVECSKVAVRPVDQNNEVPLADMAALPTNAGSMYELLVAAGAPWTTSPTVLISSGASRTGVYAVQLAKALGAGKVIAVSSAQQADLLTSLGADQVVEDAGAAGSVDVAINNGAADFAPSLNSAGATVTLGTDDAEMTSQTFAKLVELTDKGALKPVIYKSYTWTEMGAAIAAMPSAAGSIVLDVVMPVCGVMQAHWGAEGRLCPAYGQNRICTGTVGGGPAYDGMGGIAIAGGGLCMCGGRCWDALKGTPESRLTYSDRAACPMSASANCIYA